MKNGNLEIGSIGEQLGSLFKKLRPYTGMAFFLAVAALYGFILLRINVYSNVPASQSTKNAQLASQPHIDAAIAQKLTNLENNNIDTQALFNQARENPFQE